MRKTNKILLVSFFIAILLLGIGYAAIQNITLNISGTAAADPSQANFKVVFSGQPEVSDSSIVTAEILDDINATINIDKISHEGQEESATYIIKNESTDLSADLSIQATNTGEKYFSVIAELGKESLKAGESTSLKVTVRLRDFSAILESPGVNTTIGIKLDAIPVQPGDEGSSGETNNVTSSPDTFALATNEHIGEYMHVGYKLLGDNSKHTAAGRILFVDEEYVYVILSDYLPVENIPDESTLSKNNEVYTYNVWSDTDRNTLMGNINDFIIWRKLFNATYNEFAVGSPTPDLLIKSYNAKNGTNLDYQDLPTLDNTTPDYDLYVPNSTIIDGCEGYWLGEENEKNSTDAWYINYNGEIRNDSSYDVEKYGIRPVIPFHKSYPVERNDGEWESIGYVFLF